MKKINIFIIIVCLVLIGGAVYFNLTEETNQESNNNNQIVGGDKDEHGCIGSAGYSWCEPKEKCLRIWEEACYENGEQEIQYKLALKYDKPISEVKVTATKKDENYMVGSVLFATERLPGPGEGGAFMAVKNGDIWELIYDGNGSIDCVTIKANYQFPTDMLQGFCD